jgi:N-acetylneuraminic acid mutarotase
MPDGRDFEQDLRDALDREAAALPMRIEATTVHERLAARSRFPSWLLPVAIPIGGALILAALVIATFPGPAGEPGGTRGSMTPSGMVGPAGTAEPTLRPTPHPAARFGEAIALDDERLYLVGGRSGREALESATVFDGLTWTALPRLPEGRVGAGAVVTSNGRLFVFGGEGDAGAALASTLVLEPDSDAWQTVEPMPAAQASMATAELGGHAYLFGGSMPGRQRDVLIYDIESDTWSAGEPMPIAIETPQAVGADGALYVVGSLESRAVALRYDPTTDAWEQVADPPLAGGPHSLLAVDDRIWLVGGLRDPSERYPGIAFFEPALEAWTLTDDRLPPGNTWLVAYPSDGRLTVIGGHATGMTSTVVSMEAP